jgi:predicted Zn-dependent protease
MSQLKKLPEDFRNLKRQASDFGSLGSAKRDPSNRALFWAGLILVILWLGKGGLSTPSSDKIGSSQAGGTISGLAPQAAVEAVGQRLVTSSLVSRSGYTFSFHVLPDRNFVNAFILPGGQIYITAGLLSRLETEGELAGVLGHEIGHILAHPAGLPLGNSRLGPIQKAAPLEGIKTRQSTEDLKKLESSRAEELQADFWSVCILSSAGYDPRDLLGMMSAFELTTPGSERPAEIWSDHPAPANRVQHILQTIEHLDRCPK